MRRGTEVPPGFFRSDGSLLNGLRTKVAHRECFGWVEAAILLLADKGFYRLEACFSKQE